MGGTASGIGLMATRGDGSLEFIDTPAESPSPSCLALGAGMLFAAAEGAARVEAFAVGADHGLARLGSAPSGGSSPCHLTVHDGRVIASNYGDGTLGVIRNLELEQVVTPPRDAGPVPHAHSTMLLDVATLASLDLGTDSVHLHSMRGGALERIGTVPLPAGTGPRDITRDRCGALHILGELGGVLLSARWDGAALEVVASTPLPGFESGDHAAAIAEHDGVLYVGLRGSNRISVLRPAPDAQTVEPIGAVPCAGDWPRHLVTDGDVLHVANERSGDVASFRLGADGLPNLIARASPAPTPTWLLAAS